ncbi:putative molybdate-anion transporter-like [Trypanosoma theileri]|uniref:Molybdate-anion transporter n=1 Tax=Trypanosoma theileri TaxID=67003 RepID=A0A1X0P2T7_9TRYP|nr:putative molybdate-anion transporter-like [Trypanosoma theileri]ORC91205.1 putative molybdate-anion transporter-like [Trypanosoma theileri]
MVVLYVLAILYKNRQSRSVAGLSCLTVSSTSSSAALSLPAFKKFQRSFLIVYFLAMAADWMQGPYVYRLYSHYGFSRQENGILFIAGFGASLLFGTWVGPFTDMCGRRKACVMYGVIYTLSCATKHVNHFWVLIVGRLLGGVATSLLWSAFESWMISEHYTRGYDAASLSHTFSLMSTGNGLVAVVSGLVAQWAADTFQHPVAPFDVSAILLLLCMALILMQWSENYGSVQTSIFGQMREAAMVVHRDSRVALTGLQQSLFEAGMYAFIFLWTPVLESDGDVPHGIVFASFMVAVSLGGMLFNLQLERVVGCMPVVYTLAAITMLVPAFANTRFLKMIALTSFEVVVGFFWPCIATLRAAYIPEEYRASVMNLFRAPLNGIVCFLLYFQGYMGLQIIFFLSSLLHVGAALSAIRLSSLAKRHAADV